MTLSKNFIRGRDAHSSQGVEQFMLSKKPMTTEFKRRKKTLLNIVVEGSKGDAQE